VLTVYPADDTAAARIATELDCLWPATDGPALPSDLAVRPSRAVFVASGGVGGPALVARFAQSRPCVQGVRGPVAAVTPSGERRPGGGDSRRGRQDGKTVD